MRNAMVDEEIIDSSISLHPNVMKFIEIWSTYIVRDKEDTNEYDLMKKSFINAFGETVFQDWLFYSYYFVRTSTMIERGWNDDNNREVGN